MINVQLIIQQFDRIQVNFETRSIHSRLNNSKSTTNCSINIDSVGVIYLQYQFPKSNYDTTYPPTIARTIATIGFLAFSALVIAPAQAVVIDFESLAHSGGFTFPGTPYTESGFTMTNSDPNFDSYLVWGNTTPSFPGSTALAHNYLDTTTILTQVGGGAFSLTSIDLTDIYNNGANVTVNFIGHLVGGGTVTDTFTTDLTPGLETFNFSNFTNLAYVQLTPVNSPNNLIQFDNINVTSANSTAVPEPFTILGTLVGTGASVALKRKLAQRNVEDIESK